MSGGYPRPDEVTMMRVVLRHGRVPADAWPSLGKRGHYLLDKWAGRGWWEYGVSLRSGWLTDEGRAALPAAIVEAERRACAEDERTRVPVGEVVRAFACLTAIVVALAPFALANRLDDALRTWIGGEDEHG